MKKTLLGAALCASIIAGASAASAQSTVAVVTTPAPQFQPSVSGIQQGPRDGFRLRGGFSLQAGPYLPLFIGSASSAGATIGVSLRLGLQFNHLFSIMYQGTPNLGFLGIADSSGNVAAVLHASIYNSFLANFTFFNFLELGIGPSIDSVSALGCAADGSSASCSQSAGVGLGLHGRLAVMIGGFVANGPRRVGFSIALDLHPLVLPNNGAVFMGATLGLGVDWF